MANIRVSVDTKELEEALADSTLAIQAFLEDLMERVAKRLAEEVAKPIAESEYGYDEGINVYVEKRGDDYAIMAEGDEVCFIEFGAGVYADPSHLFSDKTPFEVRSGSWSEKHAQTWQRWIEGGNDPEKYPYNVEPRKGMYEAYKAILSSAGMVIRDELDK